MKIEFYDRLLEDVQLKEKSERVRFILDCLHGVNEIETVYAVYGEQDLPSTVTDLLAEKGLEILPVTLKDGVIVKMGDYPSNEELMEVSQLHFVIEDEENYREHECCGACHCGHKH